MIDKLRINQMPVSRPQFRNPDRVKEARDYVASLPEFDHEAGRAELEAIMRAGR